MASYTSGNDRLGEINLQNQFSTSSLIIYRDDNSSCSCRLQTGSKCVFRLKNKSLDNHTAELYIDFDIEVNAQGFGTTNQGAQPLTLSYSSEGRDDNGNALGNTFTLVYTYADGSVYNCQVSVPPTTIYLDLDRVRADGSGGVIFRSEASKYIGTIPWPDNNVDIVPNSQWRTSFSSTTAAGGKVAYMLIGYVANYASAYKVNPKLDYDSLGGSHYIYIYGESGTNPQIYDSYIFMQGEWHPHYVHIFS